MIKRNLPSFIELKSLLFIYFFKARLIGLYYDTQRYNEALALSSQLLKELKKLDDKQLLVEVQLLESKTYFALSNIQKAR